MGVQGSGFRVQGSGFRVQGSGSRVQGPHLREPYALKMVEHRRALAEPVGEELAYGPDDRHPLFRDLGFRLLEQGLRFLDQGHRFLD